MRTTFRNFHIQKQEEWLMGLKVVGADSVTLPAGTFDFYKVELSSADGSSDKQTLCPCSSFDSHACSTRPINTACDREIEKLLIKRV